jgi:hypothetical protein
MTTTIELTRLPEVRHCDFCHEKAEEQLAQALNDHLLKNKPTFPRLYKTAHLLHLESRRIKLLTDPEAVPSEYLYLSEPFEKVTPAMIAGEIEATQGVADASMTHDVFAIADAYQLALRDDDVRTYLDYEIFATKRWVRITELFEANNFYPEKKKNERKADDPEDIDNMLF